MTSKPRYTVVRCSWCHADHWLVKRNILTSRALPSVGSYTSEAAAQADADRRNAPRRTVVLDDEGGPL